jgi:glucose/arabinose dehydrogenase
VVIRVRLKDGVPTGEYEDFMTGFVVNDSSVWARPVGVAVAHNGPLLVSEDGNGTIWRVSYRGGPWNAFMLGSLSLAHAQTRHYRAQP